MSKFIPKKKVMPQPAWEWSSKPYSKAELAKEEEENKKYKDKMLSEKNRIETISLEQLSFKDLYKFPFRDSGYSWVYDANGNFIFQFETDNKETIDKCLAIINGDSLSAKENAFVHDGGVIYLVVGNDRRPLILIRGWGNLTGSGAYNLNGEYASKIQDTLAEYIVEKLTKQ